MSYSVRSQNGNGREFAGYVLMATVVLFGLQVLFLMGWSIVESSVDANERTLGAVAQFPPSDKPYRVDGSEDMLHFWIVNIEDEIRVFAPHSTGYGSINWCNFDWNDATNRFEDPCHGRKYQLDGVAIDGPTGRDLDQFPFTIVDDQIVINVIKLIRGTCRVTSLELSRPIAPFPECL